MYDVSIVTDALRDIVIDALATSPLFAPAGPGFSVGVSAQHPDTPTDNDCDLNLYLFHLAENKHLKNSFWTHASLTGQPPGPRRQPIAFEPMCLDLFFLLSARSETSYVQEQQVLSVALRAFHQNATVTLATPTPAGDATSELTLTMETPSSDDLSRLWQALNAPLRPAAQYRAAVVLLTPESGLTAHPEPTRWTLLAAPGEEQGGPARLLGTSRRVNYVAPDGPRSFDQTPATAAPAPGQEFLLRGRGLRDTDEVFLVDGAGAETDISAWRVPLVTPYTTVPADGVPIVLLPPASAPPAGRYQLRVGRAAEDPSWRSEPVPFSIAPWIDPAGGPTIAAAGGIFTFSARHVPAAGAELRLGATALTRVTSGTPAAGEWRTSGNTVTLAAPASLTAGTYAIRLRAADVEAEPALWAVIP
jgi:hypothetical protein